MSVRDLRLAVIGKSGSGKSSTANTIFGKKIFQSALCGSSVTQSCQKVERDVNGRKITIVDTPGLFDSEREEGHIIKEVLRSMFYLDPGPHVILFVLQIGRITNEDIDTINTFLKHFGEGLKKYIVVIFTRLDDWKRDNQDDKMNFEMYKDTLPSKAKNFITEICRNRCLPFDNTLNGQEREEEVNLLLKTIDQMLMENGGNYYSSADMENANKKMRELEDEAKRKIEEEQNRLERELRKAFESEKEVIVKMHKKETREILSKLEAALTSVGQRNHPGSYMNWVLNGLDSFAQTANNLVSFTKDARNLYLDFNKTNGNGQSRQDSKPEYLEFFFKRQLEMFQFQQMNSYAAQLHLRQYSMQDIPQKDKKDDTTLD